jgi:hypothetical protein
MYEPRSGSNELEMCQSIDWNPKYRQKRPPGLEARLWLPLNAETRPENCVSVSGPACRTRTDTETDKKDLETYQLCKSAIKRIKDGDR